MLSTWSCLLCALVTLLVLHSSESCTCQAMLHPQQHFCEDHYVIVARIRGVKNDNFTNYYRIKVNKVFKATEKALAAMGKKELVTPIHDSMCGVELQKGKVYLLTGRMSDDKLRVSICNFHQEWSTLTVKQKKAFKLLYSKGCNCKIHTCRFWDKACKTPHSNKCEWTTERGEHADCQTLESVCMKQSNGACGWNMSFRYRKCLKQRQEAIERQRALEP